VSSLATHPSQPPTATTYPGFLPSNKPMAGTVPARALRTGPASPTAIRIGRTATPASEAPPQRRCQVPRPHRDHQHPAARNLPAIRDADGSTGRNRGQRHKRLLW
jgi:hypothetical protein